MEEKRARQRQEDQEDVWVAGSHTEKVKWEPVRVLDKMLSGDRVHSAAGTASAKALGWSHACCIL